MITPIPKRPINIKLTEHQLRELLIEGLVEFFKSVKKLKCSDIKEKTKDLKAIGQTLFLLRTL